MVMQYPQRHSNMTLEVKSENYFRSKLPPSWIVHKPDPDYGQDLSIEIEEGGRYKGRELIVQLKASRRPSRNVNYETVSLSVSSYNYLRDNLRVVLLVKYVESEDEGYWLLLKDISPSNGFEKQESFTVYFPRKNRISTINWENDVVAHVRNITDMKLRAARNFPA